MVPGPELASPPETDHVTPAAPPPESVAENCSTVAPEETVLQPVQLVSMAAVPGEMAKAPLDEPTDGVPPQPASANSAIRAATARERTGQGK